MRTSTICLVGKACILACLSPMVAMAQVSDVPPTLDHLTETEHQTPAARPREAERLVSEERAPGGKVTQVRVTRGDRTYFLKPNEQVGSAFPGDGQSMLMRPAQWQILTFEAAGSRQERQQHAAEQAAGVAPPPQPAPAR